MRKKFVILLGILLLITLSIGISYASWVFGGTQKDFNTLGSKCFELTMTNESEGITLEKVYPITDQEGLELTGYTFTIKNTCNTYATYEVNLEDILNEEVKQLPNEYIKVSINDGTPENLNKLEEKEPTIENAEVSFELTSGSLAPDSEVTYTVKLWLDEETPAIEEVMNATFESKVTIGAGYIEEEELANEIQVSYESTTESINNQQEDFIIRGTSEKYNLTEYSIDNSHWSRIESPSKEVEIPYTFTEEGTYTFYIKDEVGNVSSVEIETSKLDQTLPEIQIEETNNQESIDLKITLTDEKSSLFYAISESEEEPSEWQEYTDVVTSTIHENKTYYIWYKDSVGNTSHKEYEVTTIDKEAPELEISSTITDWGESDYIKISSTDDVMGISGYSISQVEDEYNWVEIDPTSSYETEIEINVNGTYYVSVIDVYEHITTKSIMIDKIDNTAPVLSSIINSSNGEWAQSVTLSWEITEEGSGISKVEWRLNDNETWTGFSESEWYGITRSNERDDTIYIRVTDNAGNVSNIESTVMKIDRTTPSITGINSYHQILGNVSYTASHYESDVGVNGTWVTTTGDPIIDFSNVSRYQNINGAYIELENAVTKDMAIQIFYAASGSSYSEANSVRGTIKAGEKSIHLTIPTGNYAKIRSK